MNPTFISSTPVIDMYQNFKRIETEDYQSNLCSEIILPTDKERTAVCCLSSVNLENYDQWSKDNNFLKDVGGG